MHFSCWEKIAFGLLVTAWVTFGSNMIGNALIHVEKLDTPAYQVATAPAAAKPGKAQAAAATEDITTLLASADVGKGESVFKKCKACHTVEEGGKNKVGPHLWDVVERPKGSVEGFNYSDGMKAKGGTWTYVDLNTFLTSPKAFVDGTKMGFSGLNKASDRASLILYLRSMSPDPKPLP